MIFEIIISKYNKKEFKKKDTFYSAGVAPEIGCLQDIKREIENIALTIGNRLIDKKETLKRKKNE